MKIICKFCSIKDIDYEFQLPRYHVYSPKSAEKNKTMLNHLIQKYPQIKFDIYFKTEFSNTTIDDGVKIQQMYPNAIFNFARIHHKNNQKYEDYMNAFNYK